MLTVRERFKPLEVENLNVWLGGRHILHDISLTVNPGEILAIMGPSGSGKSTFIRAVTRLLDYRDDARVTGRILVYGVDVYNSDPYTVRRYMGIVFQSPNPFPHMTIYDNVAIGPRLHGIVKKKNELDELVRWALGESMLWDEVKDKLDKYPSALSGGQQQRLCLARALALKPKILFLDEPTANIDPVNARKIENAIVRIAREENVAVVIVTHTPSQAVRVSDKLAFIYNGRLVEYGPTREIALHPRHKLTEQFFRGEI